MQLTPNPVVILLAEDDDGHAVLVQRTLRRAGVHNELVRARDGQEALDYFNREGEHAGRSHNQPTLLLLDINMPRVDGVEVLRRIKADPLTASVPVIMLTTTDDAVDIARCYKAGCSVYVTKPVAYDDFVEAVRRLGLFVQIVTVPANAA